MLNEKINLVYYALRIERASNKEEEIKNILNELDKEYSLTRAEKKNVVSWFEQYFLKKEDKCQKLSIEKCVSYMDAYSLGGGPFYATDNSAILDALKKVKQIL